MEDLLNSLRGPGSGYDLLSNQYSPEGRIFQVEYASKAVENSGTAIGLRGKDGVVFAVANLDTSKLYESGANSRIFTTDCCLIGVAVAGFISDARRIVDTANTISANYKLTFGKPAPLEFIKNQLSMYIHAYTLYSSYRPFGASIMMSAYESGEPKLYCTEPSGYCASYYGCAIGKGRQAAMQEMENIDLKTMSIATLVSEAARIIYTIQEGEEDFNLELSWVGEITRGKHAPVPQNIRGNAEEYARFMLDEEFVPGEN